MKMKHSNLYHIQHTQTNENIQTCITYHIQHTQTQIQTKYKKLYIYIYKHINPSSNKQKIYINNKKKHLVSLIHGRLVIVRSTTRRCTRNLQDIHQEL